ncbi:MAG TPA: hypothetical protein PLO69_05170 [Gammaproteobacteria bacterium]|nr:hypothetical protein [Gammaproteobacteria bacterium]
MKGEAMVMSNRKLAIARERARREAAHGGICGRRASARFESLDREWWNRLGVFSPRQLMY